MFVKKGKNTHKKERSDRCISSTTSLDLEKLKTRHARSPTEVNAESETIYFLTEGIQKSDEFGYVLVFLVDDEVPVGVKQFTERI